MSVYGQRKEFIEIIRKDSNSTFIQSSERQETTFGKHLDRYTVPVYIVCLIRAQVYGTRCHWGVWQNVQFSKRESVCFLNFTDLTDLYVGCVCETWTRLAGWVSACNYYGELNSLSATQSTCRKKHECKMDAVMLLWTEPIYFLVHRHVHVLLRLVHRFLNSSGYVPLFHSNGVFVANWKMAESKSLLSTGSEVSRVCRSCFF